MLILVSPRGISLGCRWQVLDATFLSCPDAQKTPWILIQGNVKESQLVHYARQPLSFLATTRKIASLVQRPKGVCVKNNFYYLKAISAAAPWI